MSADSISRHASSSGASVLSDRLPLCGPSLGGCDVSIPFSDEHSLLPL